MASIMKPTLIAAVTAAVVTAAIPFLPVSGAFADSSTSTTSASSTTTTPQPGAFGPGHHGHHGYGFVAMSDLATYLKLTPAQLQSDLRSGQSLATIATAQGFTQSELIAELQSLISTRLSAAVTAGRMTQAQATAREQTLDANLPTLIAKTGGWGPPAGMGRMPGMRPDLLQEVSTLLHLDVTTLRSDLRSGETISEVAATQGVDATTLTQELEAYMTKQIDAMVPALLTKSFVPGK